MKASTYERPNAEERKKQMLSLWAEDPTLKERIRFIAKTDDRPMNNFFNNSVVPAIELILEATAKGLPAAKRKQYEALAKNRA